MHARGAVALDHLSLDCFEMGMWCRAVPDARARGCQDKNLKQIGIGIRLQNRKHGVPCKVRVAQKHLREEHEGESTWNC